jgi:hypothetical protein
MTTQFRMKKKINLIGSGRGHHGRDRMVAGFTTTYLQSVPITTDFGSSNPVQGKVYYTTTLCDKVCQ